MSNVTIIPQNTVTLHGNYFKVHRGQTKRRGGGIRGKVKTFSPQSRARMVEKSLTLDWDVISNDYVVRFVTLTTPEEYWHRLPFVYRCLDRMRRLFEDRGASGAFVRKEYGEKRGMLHYHFLVFIPRGLAGGWWPENSKLPEGWIGAAWRKALGFAERVRVESEKPENWECVKKYVTKYCSKAAYEQIKEPFIPDTELAKCDGVKGSLSKSHNANKQQEMPDKSGHNGNRHWYIWGSKRLPWAVKTVVTLGRNGINGTYKIKRVFRKVIKVRLQRAYMRKALGDHGKRVSDSDLRAEFLDRCGTDAIKHIARSVSKNSLMRYIRKGWFMGWRLWCNEADLAIIGNLLFSECI